MTVGASFTITCDGTATTPPCGVSLSLPAASVMEMHRVASSRGWVCTDNPRMDTCSDCVEEGGLKDGWCPPCRAGGHAGCRDSVGDGTVHVVFGREGGTCSCGCIWARGRP